MVAQTLLWNRKDRFCRANGGGWWCHRPGCSGCIPTVRWNRSLHPCGDQKDNTTFSIHSISHAKTFLKGAHHLTMWLPLVLSHTLLSPLVISLMISRWMSFCLAICSRRPLGTVVTSIIFVILNLATRISLITYQSSMQSYKYYPKYRKHQIIAQKHFNKTILNWSWSFISPSAYLLLDFM